MEFGPKTTRLLNWFGIYDDFNIRLDWIVIGLIACAVASCVWWRAAHPTPPGPIECPLGLVCA